MGITHDGEREVFQFSGSDQLRSDNDGSTLLASVEQVSKRRRHFADIVRDASPLLDTDESAAAPPLLATVGAAVGAAGGAAGGATGSAAGGAAGGAAAVTLVLPTAAGRSLCVVADPLTGEFKLSWK